MKDTPAGGNSGYNRLWSASRCGPFLGFPGTGQKTAKKSHRHSGESNGMAEHAGHEERRGTNHLVLVAAQPAGATTCRETGTWAGTGTVVPVAGLERLTEPLDGA